MLRCNRSWCNLQHALHATLQSFFLILPTRCWCYAATVLLATSNTLFMLQWQCNLWSQNAERIKPFAWKCGPQSRRAHPHSVSWTWKDCLLHRCHWCSMLRMKRLHSQEFVFSQPRFVALLQKLAMEVHKLSCQFSKKKILQTLKRLFWEKGCKMARVAWADENELALWQNAKTSKQWIQNLGSQAMPKSSFHRSATLIF